MAKSVKKRQIHIPEKDPKK